MQQFDPELLKEEWLSFAKTRLSDENRRYSHVDPFVALDETRKALIFDPTLVARHRFSPLLKMVIVDRRRVYKEETERREIDKKDRPICYASHIDSLIYSWYAFCLNKFYGAIVEDLGLSECVVAYRSPGKSTVQIVREVCEFIKKQEDCVVFCFDVTKFFDTISHAELKKNWLRVLRAHDSSIQNRLPTGHFTIFERATKFAFINKRELARHFVARKIPSKNGKMMPDGSIIDFVKEKDVQRALLKMAPLLESNPLLESAKGIPQGLAVSGVLANISMLEFDEKMHTLVSQFNGLYRRYSDDILFVVSPNGAAEIEKEVKNCILGLGLKLSEKKTERKVFHRIGSKFVCTDMTTKKASALQYLGLTFDGQYFRLRPQTLARFYRNLNGAIKRGAHRLKKINAKTYRLRDLYKRFTSYALKEKKRNFLTYAMGLHKELGPASKISTQINDDKVRARIKSTIALLK